MLAVTQSAVFWDGFVCHVYHYTHRFKKLEGQILLHLYTFFLHWRQKNRREGKTCYMQDLEILACSQVNGKGQGSSWCECVSWPVSPWFLFGCHLLLAPRSSWALSDFHIYSPLI